jgi:hypothetical protein
MSKLTYFYLPSCPHCRLAAPVSRALAEDSRYRMLRLSASTSPPKSACRKIDYWYVPCFYMGDQKIHEGHAEKSDVKAVLDRALKS